jgi:hypothetical protein
MIGGMYESAWERVQMKKATRHFKLQSSSFGNSSNSGRDV